MTDNEKLIKEARRAKQAVYLATDASVADDLSRIIGGLADALEAAEKAHNPTGHANESDTSTERVKNRADSSHVAPTDDERDAAWLRFARATDGYRVSDWTSSVAFDAGWSARSEVPEPSAEWSDASVIAALTAYDPDGFNRASWTDGAISDMRAALTAASAAKTAEREHEAARHISDLIERSSLGTPDAQALRSTVSDEKAHALVAEAHRRSEPQGEPSDSARFIGGLGPCAR